MPRRKTPAAQLDREIASALSGRLHAARKNAGKKLVVEYDVSGLSKAEIGSLENHALAQAEASDYDEEFGAVNYPDVRVTSRVVGRGKRKRLVVEYAVAGLPEDQIDSLTGAAYAQAEGADGDLWIDGEPTVTPYPDVPVTSKIV